MASKQDSITATKSFEARLLEAERWRLALMAMCMLLFAGVWELRRTFNDKVASEESVFYPIITILAVGFVVYAIGFADASRRISRQVGFPKWRAYASVVVDLGVPFGCLLVA
ncbi:MAG TPA: hypothetical protein VG797_06290, partial [Phycisphaerales bacterium]|nr:hypothetical protein [Phycisphaerales bacterium]